MVFFINQVRPDNIGIKWGLIKEKESTMIRYWATKLVPDNIGIKRGSIKEKEYTML